MLVPDEVETSKLRDAFEVGSADAVLDEPIANTGTMTTEGTGFATFVRN
jgi:hypothetical protein